MTLLIDNKPAVIKEGTSFEYRSDNRLFQDRDDYTLNIELPLHCPQNDAIFGNISRKDANINDIYFDAEIICHNFRKSGAVVITSITDDMVKVQFLEKRSFQNFYPDFDQQYIDELELGYMPNWRPQNIAELQDSSTINNGRTRPGHEDPDDIGEPPLYVTPADAWSDGDIIALPWVNNTTGNMQNRADWTGNGYRWHVKQDNDEDAEVVKGLSCQPRLHMLVQLVCDALDYAFVADLWKQSPWYHLYCFNTLPFAWGIGKWQQTLPHWTVNEFFEHLERLMLCEFDIDHKNKTITFAWSYQLTQQAGTVALEDIVDEFDATVTREDESRYRPARNRGFVTQDHEMWNFYSCYWAFRNKCFAIYRYKDFAELVDAVHNDTVYGSGGSVRNRGAFSAQAVLYAGDIDTYFMLYGVARVKNGLQTMGQETYETAYRLIMLNNFGDRIADTENWQDIEDEIGAVPVWIDDTMYAGADNYMGEVVFLDVADTDNESAGGESYSYYRSPSSTQVPLSTLLQSSLVENIRRGYPENSQRTFDCLNVGFWFGDCTPFAPQLPHPFLDRYDTKVSWQLTNNHLKHNWTLMDSGHDATLRINNDKYGNGAVIAQALHIDGNRKYEFSFLSDTMPDVRAVFFIRGKKYLCAQIKADIDHNGMSQLKKGTFYRILE